MDETITFDDIEDGEETIVIVRAVSGGIGLTVSKKTNGDLEVFMPATAASRVAAALQNSAR